MSIKIYNGRKFNGNFVEFQKLLFALHKDEGFLNLLQSRVIKTLNSINEDLNDGCIKFSTNNDPLRKIDVQRAFIKYLFNNIDNDVLKFSKHNVLSDLKQVYLQEYKALDVNIYFQMIKGKIYCVIDTTNDDILNYITNYFNFENFEYWNNVDKDPNCSSSEWSKRKKIWLEWDIDVSFKFKLFNFEKEYYLLIAMKKIIYTHF